MKHITVVLLFILIVCASCVNNSSNTRGYKSSNDSIQQQIPDSILIREMWDTAYIMNRVAKCDSMIRLENDRKELYMLYQQKVDLLGRIGRIKDAFHVQGIAVGLLPEGDMRRLEYEAIEAYLHNDKDKYSELLHKAIDDCRKYPQNSGIIFKITNYYVLLDDDKSAKSVMKEFLKQDNDEAISEYYNDFSYYKRNVLNERDALIDALKSEQEVYTPKVVVDKTDNIVHIKE